MKSLLYYCAAVLVLSSTPAIAGTLDCTGCHAKTGSGDIRPLDSAYRNITTGAFSGNHQTHMSSGATPAACSACHNNQSYLSDHRDGKIQIAWKIENYSTSLGRARYTTTRTKTTANGSVFFNQTSVPVLATCSNVKCHFETVTPIWGTNAVAAGFGCNSCHGNPPAGTGSNNYAGGIDGSHSKHVGTYLYACSKCHSDHNSDAIPFAHATSIGNRNIGVSVGQYASTDRNYLPGQTGSHTFSTCSNLYCHSDGRSQKPPYTANSTVLPKWGDPTSVVCGSCHMATTGSGFPAISTAGHTAHLTAQIGPNLGTVLTACQTCHPYTVTTHANKILEKNSCTPCHTGTEPAWTATQLACEDCHGKNATVSVMNNMSAPNKWIYFNDPRGVNGGGGHGTIYCNNCHANHTQPYTYDNGKHISGVRGDWQGLDRTNTGGAPYIMNPATWVNSTNDNYNCYACHNEYAIGQMMTHVRSQGEGANASMTCVACHDTHGAGNLHMIRSKIWYSPSQPPVAISFTNISTYVQYQAPYQGLCQVCHTLTGHFKRGVAEPAAAGQHGSKAYRNCISCHDHGITTLAAASKVTFAFQPAGCDGCHGYPPVNNMALYGKQNMYSSAKLQNYSGGGGAHTAKGHILPTVKAKDTNPWAACLPCHSGGDATHVKNSSVFSPSNNTLQRKVNVSVSVQLRNRLSNNRLPSYRLNTGDSSGNTSTCWNINCHFKPSPRWGSEK